MLFYACRYQFSCRLCVIPLMIYYCASTLSAIVLICLSVMVPSMNFLKFLPGCTITVAGMEPCQELSILGMNTLGSVSDNQATSGLSFCRSTKRASLYG